MFFLLFLIAIWLAPIRADWNETLDESIEHDYIDWEKRDFETIFVCDKGEPCECQKGDNLTLKCANNNLESANLYLPKGIGKLAIAELKENQITYLFRDKILPGHEEFLLELDLSQNQIGDIEPGAFDKFKNLLKLKLTHNDLNELSQDIFTAELANLDQLYLDYNFLGKLDAGLFDKLENLVKLVLDGNKRLEISNKVLSPALANLQILSLDRCNLKELDEDLFVNLENLRALSLSGNPLNSIPLAISPSKLPNLRALAMSQTKLAELAEGDLANAVPKLEKLYIRKSKFLTKIGPRAFAKLDKLEVLDFTESSALSHFDKDAFGKPIPLNLEYIYLQKCNLSNLEEGTMNDVFWSTLKKLQLNGNPWNCDCNLKWLATNEKAMRVASRFTAPKCTAPETLKDMLLYDAGDKIECGPPRNASSMGKFVVFLVFMVMAASLIVFGVVYARRRFMLATNYGDGGNFQVPRFLGGSGQRIPQNQMGFSSGRNIFADEDDEDEEAAMSAGEEIGTAPAPGGGPRPEFV